MTTWKDIAEQRGFTDNGNHTWTAPNGLTVAEGFVMHYCQPERTAIEVLALAACPPSANEPRWPNADDAAFPQVRRRAPLRCGARRAIAVVAHGTRRRRSRAA